eukprot:5455861-Amphidinium_carterae.1
MALSVHVNSNLGKVGSDFVTMSACTALQGTAPMSSTTSSQDTQRCQKQQVGGRRQGTLSA